MLKESFNLTDKEDFWKYLQIRSSVGSVFGLNQIQCENTLQDWMDLPSHLQSASVFYRKPLSYRGTVSLCDGLRLSWQRDLQSEINEEAWKNIISKIGWATRDARSTFIHYKTVHRYYFTPSRLFKMGWLQNDPCWKCGTDTGTYLHCFWECPLVFPFWTEVVQNLDKRTGLSSPTVPQLCLLGDTSLMAPSSPKKCPAWCRCICGGCQINPTDLEEPSETQNWGVGETDDWDIHFQAS